VAGATSIDVEFSQATDPGLDPAKRVNEDSCGYAETKFGHLFVLCDGMGGHAGGKQASDIAIRTIFEVVSSADDQVEPITALTAAIEEAGRRVYQLGGPPSNQQRPGSTCVSLLIHEGQVDVAHVGDSRAYAIRGKQIYGLTRDHSMVQELLDGGLINEQEAIGHPDSNKITRALGMSAEVDVEQREDPMDLYEGDVFVLASDGLTDLARNDDILITVNEYLKTKDIQAVCNELVALANRRGGHDNITVQVVRVVKTSGTGLVTRVQEPGAPLAGSPVSTTIEGSPAFQDDTLVQGPTFTVDDRPEPLPPAAIATTAHDPPSPTIVDNGGYTSESARPAPPTERDNGQPMLWYVVLAMAGVIGLLLALLVWAFFFR